MTTGWKVLLVRGGQLLAHPTLWHFLLHRRTRYVAAWLLALVSCGVMLYIAWVGFNNPSSGNRHDGNSGHAMIDFGGQYLMGRMMVRGYGRHLYHRYYQRQVLRESYPREDEDPRQERSDAENMMFWIMGRDDPHAAETLGSFLVPLAASHGLDVAAALAWGNETWTRERLGEVTALQVGGPLYPPINSFLYYPFALMKPRPAYRTNQILGLLLGFLSALAVRQLSEGRMWWPVAVVAVLLFPGFAGSLMLGQNAALTLALVLWGWLLIARGRPAWGGVVWGCLAFKPVWALAFFLVPALTRRWRVCLAMAATGVLLAAATLPAVGLEGWQNWLHVGAEAAQVYKADQNWIPLSRDLLSLPRRWFDFDRYPYYERQDNLEMEIVGWALLLAVFEVTVRLTVLRGNRVQAGTGPLPAFVFLGAWMSCFHFMYYDVLLAALPVFLLLTEPGRYLIPRLLAIIPLGKSSAGKGLQTTYMPRRAPGYPVAPFLLPARPENVWVCNSPTLTLYAALSSTALLFPLFGFNARSFPWDTIFLMILWAWCAVLITWELPAVPESVPLDEGLPSALVLPIPVRAEKLVQASADIGGAH
jgi:hypothetical protein